ncbi:MAG: hypothetical protein ACFFAN_12810 [Promethearchaeota archaeon]
MNSSENLLIPDRQFKIKVCLLGGTEHYKNYFQKLISYNCLPVENKNCIGVNLSKFNYYHEFNNFEFYLWNINCNKRWAFLRTTFYHGAEAMIIFISEMKVNQIKDYLKEVKLRMPVIQIYFCIILEKYTKEQIINTYLKSNEFYSLIELNNIKINSISETSELLDHICSTYKVKIITKKDDDNFNIYFIPFNALLNKCEIKDKCNNYYEPANNNLGVNQNRRVNTLLIKNYLSKLGLKIKEDCFASDWIQIKNKDYGTFFIFLRNGKINLFPKICQICKEKACKKKIAAPYPICIEQRSKGWTNLRGLGQPELLVLSKIFAIQTNTFPSSVLKQIKNINKCIKRK